MQGKGCNNPRQTSGMGSVDIQDPAIGNLTVSGYVTSE